MSEKFTEYLGYYIKIKCDKFCCSGEIVSVDPNTVVVTNSAINDVVTTTKFLGINQTLIREVDIIRSPVSKKNSENVQCDEVNAAVNVYTSSTQPPVIKRGGPSSAVHRKMLQKSRSSQEKIHKSRSSNFPDNNNRSGELCNLIPKNLNGGCHNDFSKSGNSNFNDLMSRSRKTSHETFSKEPAWMDYAVNKDSSSFDFDSNLALFDKKEFYSNNDKRKITGSPESSDSGGGLQMNVIRNDDRNDKDFKKQTELPPFPTSDRSKSISDFIKQIEDSENIKEKKNIPTARRRLGVLVTPVGDQLSKDCSNKKCDQETVSPPNSFMNKRSFQQQPDIVQEVTKSQLSNSDPQIVEPSTILFIDSPSKDFQIFTDFWKLDNDCKFPVFTLKQKEKLLNCANKFGYDDRTIAEYVGETLSEFVLNQVGGATRLNGSNIHHVPKIAILLSRCAASVFVVSMARYLLGSGCYVLAYYDSNCHEANEDVDIELKLLNNSFSKYHASYGFNCITSSFKDLKSKTFDYIISGLESESNIHPPSDELIDWSFSQKTPILTINPTKMSYLLWKVAAFIGVPTNDSKNLLVRTRYGDEHGYLTPRTDGIVGLEIDKMFKKPDGLVLLCNINLPIAVYQLLKLNYKSPFTSKNWIRLYRENDLLFVE